MNPDGRVAMSMLRDHRISFWLCMLYSVLAVGFMWLACWVVIGNEYTWQTFAAQFVFFVQGAFWYVTLIRRFKHLRMVHKTLKEKGVI